MTVDQETRLKAEAFDYLTTDRLTRKRAREALDLAKFVNARRPVSTEREVQE